MTSDWTKLDARVDGSVVPRDAAEYERDRRSMAWNARVPDRFPDALVHVSSRDDVREAVRFARDHDLKVAVRGGGHSWCSSSLREGGLLLDLSGLAHVEVDAGARRATVEPGVTGSDLLEALMPHALAFPVGHCPSVPLSGFLLSGGFGWNSGGWGPASASVRAIDVVDANGEALRADAERSPELFWAARGAGAGFFGVVTRFHLDLHLLPRAIRTSTLTFPAEALEGISAWLPELAANLPPQVELSGVIAKAPPDTGLDRVLVLSATAFADSDEDARGWLAPLEEGPGLAAPVKDLVRETPFPALYEAFGGLFPDEHRYVADVLSFDRPPQEVLPALQEVMRAAPSPRSLAVFVLLPPDASEGAELPDMAVSILGSTYVALYGISGNPAEDDAHDRWMRVACASLDSMKAGHYIGETDLAAHADRASCSFSEESWRRLGKLKRRYDPEDRFFSYLTPEEAATAG
jgi:FAD/FMN-containing dehydrogenase